MAATSDSQMEVIKRAKVLMVGAGGIGCELLKTLVLSGFQDIHIIGGNRVEAAAKKGNAYSWRLFFGEKKKTT